MADAWKFIVPVPAEKQIEQLKYFNWQIVRWRSLVSSSCNCIIFWWYWYIVCLIIKEVFKSFVSVVCVQLEKLSLKKRLLQLYVDSEFEF